MEVDVLLVTISVYYEVHVFYFFSYETRYLDIHELGNLKMHILNPVTFINKFGKPGKMYHEIWGVVHYLFLAHISTAIARGAVKMSIIDGWINDFVSHMDC